MLVLEDRGLIFDATQQPAERRIAFFTSLCPLQSGTMLCGFQNGSGKHSLVSTARICRSTDAGQTWSVLPVEFSKVINGVPGSLSGAELVEVEPGRLLLFATWFDRSEPERPLFDPVSEGILKSKQLLAVSHDEGNTWSPWQELSTGELKGCAGTGPVLRWSNGTIAYPFESFKEFDDPRPGRHAAWILISQDGGKSFSAPLQVAQHPEHVVYYWDQRLCTNDVPGSFTALFWTHHLAEQRDLTVHHRWGQVTGLGTPEPGIATGPIETTAIPGQIAAPYRLGKNELLAFVVDRSRPGTMTLWNSHDNGRTWPEQERLIVHTHDERAKISQGPTNIDFKQYWEDMGKWSFGHPAMRQISPEHVLLAWYAGAPDCMSLHWARVRFA